MKKLLSILLTVTLLIGCLGGCGTQAVSSAEPAPAPSAAPETAAPAPADTTAEAEAASDSAAEPEPDYDEVLAIVHTNDVHGFIDIEPYVKAVADSCKAQYGEQNVITVSAGDVFAGGNAVAHLYNGETIPPIMSAAGYDVMVPGNNDFNLGGDQLLVLSGMFGDRPTVICANMYDQVLDENGEVLVDEDENPIPGDTIFPRTMTWETAGGVKVGLFGLTIAYGPVNDYFAGAGSVDSAQSAVEELQTEGCSVILGIGHTGWNDDLVTPTSNDVTSAQLVQEVIGIDAYVDAHSHSTIEGGSGWICPETGTLVNQAACKGQCVGLMLLYIKDGAVVEKEGRLLTEEELAAEYTPDAAVQALVDEAWARLEGDAGELYLESEYFLNGLRSNESPDGRSIRTDETNLGDLVADALRWTAKTDVALMPGFRIRSSVQEGKVYSINLYDVFANGCDLYTFELTGQELLEKMAGSLVDLPTESTQFNQISGASFGYLVTPGETADGGKVFTIVNPMVGGQPLDLSKTYTLAMDASGPDAPEDQEPIISGMEAAAEAMGAYLKSADCTVYPDIPVPDNRIVPLDTLPEGAVTYTVEMAAMGPGGPGGPPPA